MAMSQSFGTDYMSFEDIKTELRHMLNDPNEPIPGKQKQKFVQLTIVERLSFIIKKTTISKNR
jgi:hypothetical protein